MQVSRYSQDVPVDEKKITRVQGNRIRVILMDSLGYNHRIHAASPHNKLIAIQCDDGLIPVRLKKPKS